MASGETARRKLKFPKPTDAFKATKDWEEFVNQLDNDAETGQGTEAERTAAKTRGRFYVVQGDGTAEKNGLMWWDTGAAWLAIQNRIADSQVYSAEVARTEATEYEPSAIRATLVRATFQWTTGAELLGVEILVGGKKAYTFQALGFTSWETIDTATFLVPPGLKWQWKKLGAKGVSTAGSSYLPI